MAGRRVRDESEAVAMVEEARRLGVTVSDVARARGIDGRSMQAWSMVLTKRQRSHVEHFVELVPIKEPQQVSASCSYRVWVGELAVEVDDNFNERTLQRLVTVLRTC